MITQKQINNMSKQEKYALAFELLEEAQQLLDDAYEAHLKKELNIQ